jgi:hypothetical protein
MLRVDTLQVKGGGHQTNPGFSSTTGVHISLKKLSEIEYDAQKNVVTVGAGLTWDDVYAALDPLGVGVVGGRSTGVRNHIITFEHDYITCIFRLVLLDSFSVEVSNRPQTHRSPVHPIARGSVQVILSRQTNTVLLRTTLLRTISSCPMALLSPQIRMNIRNSSGLSR